MIEFVDRTLLDPVVLAVIGYACFVAMVLLLMKASRAGDDALAIRRERLKQAALRNEDEAA
jgi:hypothetical protein